MEPYRLHVLCCTNDKKEQHCGNHGGHGVYDAMLDEMKRRGLKEIRVTKMGCNSQHHVGPVMVIYPEGIWYKEVKVEDVPEIVEKHILGGQVVERLLLAKNVIGCVPSAPLNREPRHSVSGEF